MSAIGDIWQDVWADVWDTVWLDTSPPSPIPSLVISPSRRYRNAFGTSSVKYPLYQPTAVLQERLRFSREDIPLIKRCNSYYTSTGRYPSRGWLLLARSDYNQLDKYSTSLQLDIAGVGNPDNISTIGNLAIVQGRCVTRGLANDNNALYLVEITDGRGILYNEWFQFPLTKQYNIRAPAYPQTFHPQSMNSGTTWTWATMLEDIWTEMQSFLGSFPGLPITPSGTPEGFWFAGVPAWPALCDVLEHLGMTVAHNPTSSTPYTIVQQNVADSAYNTLLTRYIPNLKDDLEWIDQGAARVPATVKVFFKRRNSIYGSEETVRYDSPQWDMEAYYSVSVNAPASFSSAVGVHFLWDDFTIRYDQDGLPLAEDVAEATAIAAERVTQYYARINANNYTSRTYAGALPFTTGSQVDGVRWYQDHDNARSGWCTQVVYGAQPPFANIWHTQYQNYHRSQ